MIPSSVPFDYHNAEVAKTFDSMLAKPVSWRAICGCGWSGPVRDIKSAAEDDALAHDTTENPVASHESP